MMGLFPFNQTSNSNFMKNFINILFSLFLLGVGSSSAQEQSKAQILMDAEFYFEQRNYIDALPLYSKLDSLYPNIDYKFKLGICYLYRTDKIKTSTEYLEMVLEKKPKVEDLHYYLGRSYALNNKFDEAIESFNQALNGKTSKENITKFLLLGAPTTHRNFRVSRNWEGLETLIMPVRANSAS